MPKAAAKEKAPAKEKAAKKEKAPAKEKKAKDPNAPKKPMVRTGRYAAVAPSDACLKQWQLLCM
jgi:hypothetical protein